MKRAISMVFFSPMDLPQSSKRIACAFVVPVYNEAESIENTLRRLKAVAHSLPEVEVEIICVNDGSGDASPQILASQQGITVLTHSQNRGYGAALKTGLDYCSQEWVAIVDSDGTYPIEDLPRLMKEAVPPIHMVVGARRGVGIQRDPHKRLARWILRQLVKSLTGVFVPDLNSGMRIFRRSLYQQFRHLLPLGFSFTTTITVASLYSGYGIKYVEVDYAKRAGKSHIRPIQDFIRFVTLIVRLASYFEPLKFFIPLSLIIGLLGTVRGLRDVLVTGRIGSLGVILIFMGLQVFLTGIVVDVVVRRSEAFGVQGRREIENSK